MDAQNLVEPLASLLTAHGIEFHTEKEWVAPNGQLPAMRATLYPRESSGQLDVDVLLESRELLKESFAGLATGDAGIRDAFHNFCANSFHVLLAAFWDKIDPEQVTVATWQLGGRPYTAYIGNLGMRTMGESPPPKVAEGYLESLENVITNSALVGEVLWFRNFFCDIQGDRTFESMVNNEVWSEGVENLKSLPWEKSAQYYSVRNFLILRASGVSGSGD